MSTKAKKRSGAVGLILLVLIALATPANAEWRSAETDNFIIHADMREDRLREMALGLERFDRVLRHLTHQQNEFVPIKMRILVLRDAEYVSAYSEGEYAGYYVPDIRGPYAVVPRRNVGSGAFELERREILFYEYARHFLARYLSPSYPFWYREGLAQLYSTVEFRRDGRIDVGRAPRAIANQLGMLARLGYWLPVRDLLSNEFPAVSLTYGEGWLLAHRGMFDPQLGHELGEYLNAVHQGSSGRETYDRIFGERDPPLDEVLREYLAGYRFPFIPMEVDLGAIAEPRITAMSDEEAELVLFRMRFSGQIENDLEQALDDYPDNAQLYAEQARLLLAQDDFASARSAAYRALAISPNTLDAHLYAAQALIGLAADDPTSPHWAEARDHALQANRIDPDNAFALVCYYLSWSDRAARPENALASLERAFALIPQNPAIRVLLGGEYLEAGRYSEARLIVAMVADAPEGGELQAYAAVLQRLASRELDFGHAREIAEQLRTERERQRAELGEVVAVEFPTAPRQSDFNRMDWNWATTRSLFDGRFP